MSKHDDNRGGDDLPDDEHEEDEPDRPETTPSWYEIRRAVFARDRKCVNCGRLVQDGEVHDPDHIVPRAAGGANRHSNIATLCRRCHNAKHGEGVAPSVACASTGDMTDREFRWFEHFMKEMLPALIRVLNSHHGGATADVNPYFGLDDGTAWRLPLGDLRCVDRQLAEVDELYRGLHADQYM